MANLSVPNLTKAVTEALKSDPPDTLPVEYVVEYADGPRATTVRNDWVLLDRGQDGVVALVGLPDGRTALALCGSGRWKDEDFKPPTPAPADRLATMPSHVYRNTYDGARRVEIEFVESTTEWWAGPGRNVEPGEAGRAHPVLNVDTYYGPGLRALAEAAVGEEADPEVLDRVHRAMQMVSRHSFQRAWKEQGQGWF